MRVMIALVLAGLLATARAGASLIGTTSGWGRSSPSPELSGLLRRAGSLPAALTPSRSTAHPDATPDNPAAPSPPSP